MQFLDKLTQWAATQADILALALVGSHARNAAEETSNTIVGSLAFFAFLAVETDAPLTGTRESATWSGAEGIWNAWQNNGDPGGPGWWLSITPP